MLYGFGNPKAVDGKGERGVRHSTVQASPDNNEALPQQAFTRRRVIQRITKPQGLWLGAVDSWQHEKVSYRSRRMLQTPSKG